MATLLDGIRQRSLRPREDSRPTSLFRKSIAAEALGSSAAAASAARARAGGQQLQTQEQEDEEEASDIILPLAPPRHLACGNSHTLYLSAASGPSGEHNGSGARVVGWGGNRHNPLGLCLDLDQWPRREGDEAMLLAASLEEVRVPSADVLYWQLSLNESLKQARQRLMFPDFYSVACGKSHSLVLERLDNVDHDEDGNLEDPDLDLDQDGEGFQDTLSPSHRPRRRLGTSSPRSPPMSPSAWSRGRGRLGSSNNPSGSPTSTNYMSNTNNNNNSSSGGMNDDGSGAPTRLRRSRLWSVGLNTNGQRGANIDKHKEETGAPSLVRFPTPPNSRLVVQRIACGSDHSLALVDVLGTGVMASPTHGRVFAWGLGSSGALGLGDWNDAQNPRELRFPNERGDLGAGNLRGRGKSATESWDRKTVIIHVAAGTKHSLALDCFGKVYAWGYGGNGRLGLGKERGGIGMESFISTNVPEQVRSVSAPLRFVAAGDAHSASIDTFGGLYTWGDGSCGRCGHGWTTDTTWPTQVEGLAGTAMSQVALGLHHSVATTVKGKLWAWGKGPATGVEHASSSSIPFPELVGLPDQVPVDQIAAGPLHTVVLLCDGNLVCFGSRSESRLPFFVADPNLGFVGDFQPRKIEVRHKGLCSGNAQLLDSDTSPSRRLASSSRWWPANLFAGGSFSGISTQSMAEANNLWVWGASCVASAGEDADEEEESDLWQPTLVRRNLRGRVQMVAAGYEHCLVVADGRLYSWGSGAKGQLGIGSTASRRYPQLLPYPTDVLTIAAGEEHSACIGYGGIAYVWGLSESGRLGLGRSASEDLQLTPKQVLLEQEDRKKSSRLPTFRSVDCGAEHTAFITEDHKLLTCGAGWFGRLGQGTTTNSYIPRQTSLPSEVRCSRVHCGTHHTCVIDAKGSLWVCGKDVSICKTTPGHQLDFTLFEPFVGFEASKTVKSLATSDDHTLAIVADDSPDFGGTELWCWGRNKYGQLGFPASSCSSLSWPAQLKIPGCETMGPDASHLHAQVVAGPRHCLLLASRSSGCGRSRAGEPTVYGWGSLTAGRLGFTHAEVGKGLNFQDGCPPRPLAPSWKVVPTTAAPEPASMTTLTTTEFAAEAGETRDEDSEGGKPMNFLQAQEQLWAERKDQKLPQLLERQQRAEVIYRSFLEELGATFRKPPDHRGPITEYSLRRADERLEREYVRTLTCLGLVGRPPRLERLCRTDRSIRQKLHLVEELIFALQQQPAYLCSLHARLRQKLRDGEIAGFLRISKRLFGDLTCNRTRNLFVCLVRALATAEMQEATLLSEFCQPSRSVVPPLLSHICCHNLCYEAIWLPILDPTNEQSLVSRILRFTVSADGQTPRNIRSVRGFDDCSGLFNVDIEEAEAILRQQRSFRTRLKDSELPPHLQRNLNAAVQAQTSALKSFCVSKLTTATSSAIAALSAASVNAGQVVEFLELFLSDVLRGDRSYPKPGLRSVTNLLHSVWYLVKRSKFAKYSTYRLHGRWTTAAAMPLISLVLSNIISELLDRFIADDMFGMLRQKLQQKATELDASLVQKHNAIFRQGKSRIDEEDAKVIGEAKEDPALPTRVFWNIKMVSRFLRSCGDPGADLPTKLGEAASEIQKIIGKGLLEALGEECSGQPGEVLCWEADSTDSQLLSSVFKSHFCLRPSVVRLSTEDILQLTNMLWTHMEPIQESKNVVNYGVRLKEQDMDVVFKLVREILDRKVLLPTGDQVEGPALWSSGDLVIASLHGEWHNFRVRSRFLEFSGSDPDQEEPARSPIIVCSRTGAPVPPELALGTSRDQDGMIKMNHEDWNLELPMVKVDSAGEVSAFEKLEECLEALSGHMMTDRQVKYPVGAGSSLSELARDFERFQLKITQDVEKGNGDFSAEVVLKRLDSGRQVLSKLRQLRMEDHVDYGSDFLTYLDKSHLRRSNTEAYFDNLFSAAEEVRRAAIAYHRELKDIHSATLAAIDFTQTSEMPASILSNAERRSVIMTFKRARRLKIRHRNHRPTQAQAALDTLRLAKTDVEVEAQKELIDVPTKTFKCRKLVDKGVVTKLEAEVVPHREKLWITFTSKDEGCLIQVFIRSNKLREFFVPRQTLSLTEGSGKHASLTFSTPEDGLLWFNGGRLRWLLGFIGAETGL